MPQVSPYHLIKFIVDISYDDFAKRENPNWNTWLDAVAKIYLDKIPEKVLYALMTKNNDELTRVCSKVLETMNKNVTSKEEEAQAKHEQWIRRRDAGNKRVHEMRIMNRKQNEQEAMIKYNEALASYMDQMMPLWKDQIKLCMEKRVAEETSWHIP